MDEWFTDINENISDEKKVCKLMVGNKIDMKDECVITREVGIECARKNNCIFIETSAKTGEGINEIFWVIANELLDIRKGKPEKDAFIELPDGFKKNDSNKCC
jgi:GTPase SAR1 family protein